MAQELPPLTPELRAYALRLHLEGIPYSEIGQKLRCAKAVAWRAVQFEKKFGPKLPDAPAPEIAIPAPVIPPPVIPVSVPAQFVPPPPPFLVGAPDPSDLPVEPKPTPPDLFARLEKEQRPSKRKREPAPSTEAEPFDVVTTLESTLRSLEDSLPGLAGPARHKEKMAVIKQISDIAIRLVKIKAGQVDDSATGPDYKASAERARARLRAMLAKRKAGVW